MTELQEICRLIQLGFENYKITPNAKPYWQTLREKTELKTFEDSCVALRFLTEAINWEYGPAKDIKERLLNLIKVQMKIPIIKKYVL